MREVIDEIEAGGTPDFSTLLEAFGEAAPLLREFSATPQDAIWHAEGDVEAHVRMVLDETWQFLESRNAGGEERVLHALAALFHDIAKPVTTRERALDGQTRIISPRHADRGRSYLAYRSLDWPLAEKTRRELLALVGHHHDPRRHVHDSAPRSAWWRLAELASLAELYHLEVADVRGRICDDLDEQLQTLELFKLFAEEHGVWCERDPWAAWREHVRDAWQDESAAFQRFAVARTLSDARAGAIFTPEEGVARSWSLRDGFGHLVVLCGPSGSGKTTWIEQNSNGREVVSLDAIRDELTGDATDQSRNGEVRQIAQERLKRALADHRDVIWDGTNLRREFRRVPIGIGEAYGALTTLIVFETSPAVCALRNRARKRSVPENVLERQFATAEFPYADEAHEVVFIHPERGREAGLS